MNMKFILKLNKLNQIERTKFKNENQYRKEKMKLKNQKMKLKVKSNWNNISKI